MVGLVYGSQRQDTMCLRKLIKKMANIENFIFDSDYPTDKIVFMHEGEINITSTWSYCRDFVNTHIPTQLYAEGDYKLPGSDTVYPIDGSTSGESSTQVTLASFMYQDECWTVVTALTTESSLVGKKLPYRIWGYYDEEAAKNININATTNVSKSKLALNTDNNYPRFLGDKHIQQGQTYTHNLGFIPIVRAWSLYENESMPMPDGTMATVNVYWPKSGAYFGDATGSYYAVQVSKTQIATFVSPTPNPGVAYPTETYFRMYKL